MATLPKHTLTAEEFAALPLEGLRSELVEGEIHTMAPTFEDHGAITMQLSGHLWQHITAHRLGKLFAAETGFLIGRNPDTVRAPDIAFIQRARLTSAQPQPRWVPIVPDLVVEVASSSDRPAELAAKVAMWLDVGVRLAWVVWPETRTVAVHHPGETVRTLSEAETLEGGEVVPGFALPVATIFTDA